MSHEPRFEREFDARPEEAFDALTGPEGLREMYGLDEPGWIVESRGGVRVGGTWSVAFGPSPEELYCFVHTFGVLERPRRVADTSAQTNPDGSGFETSIEITLEERERKTLMVLVEKGFPSTRVKDLHEAGTPHAFDRVDRFIYARVSNEGSGR